MFCKTDSDEFQVKKSGIGIDASLGVGVGYRDVAEKQYSYSLLDISFTFLHNTKDIIICFLLSIVMFRRVLFM
jgi:hypothetical protein